MKEIAQERCRRCGEEGREVGVRGEGTGEPTVLCADCLEAVYPEGRGLPVAMDMDGNLYFINKPKNCMIILFAYGDTPYTACTEVSLEDEEECGCGFTLC